MPSPVPGCGSSSGHSRDQQEQLCIRTGDSEQNTCFAPGTCEGGRPILQTRPPWSCKLGHGVWLQKCCWDTFSHQGALFLLLRCFHQEPLKLRFYRSFHCRDYKLKCLLGPAIFIHLAQILYIKHIQALSPSIKICSLPFVFLENLHPLLLFLVLNILQRHWHESDIAFLFILWEKYRASTVLNSSWHWLSPSRTPSSVVGLWQDGELLTPARLIYCDARNQAPQNLFLRETRNPDFYVSVSDF